MASVAYNPRRYNPPRGYAGARYSELPYEYQAFLDKPFKGNVTWQHRSVPEESVYKRDFTSLRGDFQSFLIDRYGARFANKVIAELAGSGQIVSRHSNPLFLPNPKRGTFEAILRKSSGDEWLSGPLSGHSLDAELRYLEGVYGKGNVSYLPTATASNLAKEGRIKGWRKKNPLFLPKSLFDSYIVKSDGNEVSVDKIQTLSGAERKVRELARKYPCVGFSIASAKHGGTIKHYAASVGKSAPKVDEDNSREYKQTQTKEAKANMRFRLYVDGDEFADYETKAEAEKVGRKEAGSGGKWRVKEVQANPTTQLSLIWEAGYHLWKLQTPNGAVLEFRFRKQAVDFAEQKGWKWRIEGSKRPNPLTGSPSHDIPLELRHGHSQRQSEAIAMGAERRMQNPSQYTEQYLRTNIRRGVGYGLTVGSFLAGELRGSAKKYSAGYERALKNDLENEVDEDRAFKSKSYSGGVAYYPERGTPGDKENPLSIFPTRRAALSFASRTPGSSIIPAASGGYVVRYPVSRNPEYAGEPMRSEHGHRWYYFIPFMPNLGRRHAGTGGYFDSLADAKDYAKSYSKSLKGEWKGKPVEIQDVHHAVVSKRNPDDSGSAAELYSQFHGEPSDGETIYEETVEIPDRFVELGDLTEMKVATLLGKEATICAPDPDRYDLHEIVKLASSPDGNQLYFLGGDQKLELDKLGFKNGEVKPHMFIGVLIEVTYRTRKGFDKFKLTDYYHGLGEETGNQPMLTYDHTNGLMSVVGGEYHVRDVGIVN